MKIESALVETEIGHTKIQISAEPEIDLLIGELNAKTNLFLFESISIVD